MIIHYIVEETFFVVIVYKCLVQKKYCFKIYDKQRIKMPKKGECIKFKNYERKIKSSRMIY